MNRIMALIISFAVILSFMQLNINAQEMEDDEEISDSSKTKVFDMGRVVVKGKKKVNIENATTTTNVTALDIEAREEKDLSDTLRMIPGITTFQHGKGHIRFTMRGYDMDKVALLVDGIPATDVYEANVDISKIPVSNASEIIINRGTCSALYGTTGTIGSINIVTKKPAELYTKAGAEYGIGNSYSLNVAHGMPIGNFFYWVTANADRQAPFDVSAKLDKKTRQEWYDRLIRYDLYGDAIDLTNEANYRYLNETGERPHSEMLKYNFTGKAGYMALPRLETGLSASYTQSKSKRYTLSASSTSEYSVEDSEWSDPNNQLGSTAFEWPLVYNYTVAPYFKFEKDAFNIKGNIYYSHTHEVLSAFSNASHTEISRFWQRFESNWQNSIFGLNIFPSYAINTWNKLNASLLYRWDRHFEREKIKPDFMVYPGPAWQNQDMQDALAYHGDDWFDTTEITAQQITFAVEDEMNINFINITAGVSYDAQKLGDYKNLENYSDTSMTDQYIAKEDAAIWGTRDSFNPVLAATAEPLKDFLVLRASYSQKAKLPTMAMYASLTDTTDTVIRAEKSYNANAGLELLFLDRTYSFRTDYFYSRYKDKLARIWDDTLGNNVYSNISGVSMQGIETIISGKQKDIFDGLDIGFELSYVYTMIKNLDSGNRDTMIYKGEKMENTPEHQLILDLRLDYATNTSLNIFGQYTAGSIRYVMKSAPATTDPYTTACFEEAELNDPLLFNVKLAQKFLEKYEAYALVKNVFDDYKADPFNPGPGRQYFLGAKAEF